MPFEAFEAQSEWLMEQFDEHCFHEDYEIDGDSDGDGEPLRYFESRPYGTGHYLSERGNTYQFVPAWTFKETITITGYEPEYINWDGSGGDTYVCRYHPETGKELDPNITEDCRYVRCVAPRRYPIRIPVARIPTSDVLSPTIGRITWTPTYKRYSDTYEYTTTDLGSVRIGYRFPADVHEDEIVNILMNETRIHFNRINA